MSQALSELREPQSRSFLRGPRVVIVAIVAALLLAAFSVNASYNQLVRADQAVQAQWAQVENAYQRRTDLVPNLVETVKGAANFEKDTFTAVTQARTGVAWPKAGSVPSGAELEKFQQTQEQLGSALSRLLVTVERYPELKATQAFRDLQAQLEGSENRIAVERMRFNEAAQAFNGRRSSFPTLRSHGDILELEQIHRLQNEVAQLPPDVTKEKKPE